MTSAADHTQRADQHRPTDQTALAAAARQLATQGLTPWDIAQALRIAEATVREMLRCSA